MPAEKGSTKRDARLPHGQDARAPIIQRNRFQHDTALIQQFDRIALVQHAFYHHGTVNTRHTIVSLRYLLQYRRGFFSGVGIERDHHATSIALQNPDD